MVKRLRIAFVTILPSPYQRDLFGALAARDDVDLRVYYMEFETPDSPWPIAQRDAAFVLTPVRDTVADD